MSESPAVMKALALKKELDDHIRTGDKRALIYSLRQDLCRDWGVSSPERALALAMNELIKEAVPEYRKISRQREMIGSGSAAQRKQRPNATANRQRRK